MSDKSELKEWRIAGVTDNSKMLILSPIQRTITGVSIKLINILMCAKLAIDTVPHTDANAEKNC